MMQQLNQVLLSFKLRCHTKEDINFIIDKIRGKDMMVSGILYLLQKTIQFFELHFEELIKIANYNMVDYTNIYNAQIPLVIDVSFSSYVSILKKLILILGKNPKKFFHKVTKLLNQYENKNNISSRTFGINLYDAFQVYSEKQKALFFLEKQDILTKKDYQSVMEYFMLEYIKRGPIVKNEQIKHKTKFKVNYEGNYKKIEILSSSNVWELIARIIFEFKVNISFYTLYYSKDNKKEKIKKKQYNQKIYKYFNGAQNGKEKIVEINMKCKGNKELRYLYFYGNHSFNPNIFDLVVIWARKCIEKKNKIFPLNKEYFEISKDFKSEDEILRYLIEEGLNKNYNILNLIIGYDNSNEPYLRNFEEIPEIEKLINIKSIEEGVIEESEEEKKLKEKIKIYDEIKDKEFQEYTINEIKEIIVNEIINKKKEKVIKKMSCSLFCYFPFWYQIKENDFIKKLKNIMHLHISKVQIISLIKLKNEELDYIHKNLSNLDRSKRNDQWLLNIVERIIKNSLDFKETKKFFSIKAVNNKLSDIQLLKCCFNLIRLNNPDILIEHLTQFLKFQNLNSIDEVPLFLLKYFLEILMIYEIPPQIDNNNNIIFDTNIKNYFLKLITLLLPEDNNDMAMKLLRNIFLCSFKYCQMAPSTFNQETINTIKEKMKNYNFKCHFSAKAFLLGYKPTFLEGKKTKIIRLFNNSYLNVILCLMFLENINKDKLGDNFKEIFQYFEKIDFGELFLSQYKVFGFGGIQEEINYSKIILEKEPKSDFESIEEACKYFTKNNPNYPITIISKEKEKEEGEEKLLNETYKNYKYFMRQMDDDFNEEQYKKNKIIIKAIVKFNNPKVRQMLIMSNNFYAKIGNKDQIFKFNYLFLKRKKTLNKYPYEQISHFFRNFKDAKNALLKSNISNCKDFILEFFCNFADILKEKNRISIKINSKKTKEDFINFIINNFEEYKISKPEEYKTFINIFNI